MLLIRQAWHNRLTWTAGGWFVLAASLAHGQQPESFKTGGALRRQLDEQVGITWQGHNLRNGLARLSQSYGVAIFLDRRIDPDQELTLAVRDEPLEVLMKRVAAEAGAGMAIIGPVVYLGPPETASRLPTLAALRRQDASKLSNDAKARLLRAEACHWDELAQPRQLLEGLAEKAGVKVENGDAIPLDLWPAMSLPALPWTDRLTLLLSGCDLTFEIGNGGSSIRLVPQPTMAALTKTNSPRDDAQTAKSVRAAKPAKGGGEKLYSLRVANEPAGKVARTVAQSLGKELKYDRRVLESLKQPVTFNLQNASLDFLLTTTLEPLGLQYRLTDDALEIVEKE